MLIPLLTLLGIAQATTFPSLTLESLAGNTLQIPHDLGNQSILAIAFSRDHSTDLESWETPLQRSGLPFAAVLLMGEMNSTLKATIGLAMRASLESDREARTFLLTGDNTALLNTLQSRDTTQLVLLRLSGSNIIHEVRGAWSSVSAAALGI